MGSWANLALSFPGRELGHFEFDRHLEHALGTEPNGLGERSTASGQAKDLFLEKLTGELAFHGCRLLSALPGQVRTRSVFTASLGRYPLTPLPFAFDRRPDFGSLLVCDGHFPSGRNDSSWGKMAGAASVRSRVGILPEFIFATGPEEQLPALFAQKLGSADFVFLPMTLS